MVLVFAAWALHASTGFAAAPIARGTEEAWNGYVAVSQIWDSNAQSFLIAPNGRWFAATWDGASDIAIVDMTSGAILRRLSAKGGTISAGAITSDSNVVVARLHDGRLLAWRAETGQSEVSPPTDLQLQVLKADAPGAVKNPYAGRFLSEPDGRLIVEVSGGKPAMKPVRVALDDVQSVVHTGCGVAPGAAAFDGTHLLVSRGGGEDALLFALPAEAFELKGGIFRKMWEAPCGMGGGAVMDDSRYFLIDSPAPVGPLTIWDLRSNRVAARFEDSDGVFAMAADGRVVVTTGFKDESKLFQISRDHRHTTVPRHIDDIVALTLSPNAHWLAAQVRPDRTDLPDSVVVVSMTDGRQTKSVASPSAAQPIIAVKVSNDGDVALEFRKIEEPEEIDGRQILARSRDGHLAAVEGDADDQTSLVFDMRSHRLAARVPGRVERFTRDGRFVVTQDRSLFDLEVQKLVWTIQGTPDDTGYVMLFADGCVQTSPGAERFVALVRGFEVRPYDALAARAFSKPGCTGRPAYSGAGSGKQSGTR